MTIIDKKSEECSKIASKLNYQIEYIPGEIIDHDMYRAYIPNSEVSSCGPTKDIAISNAIEFMASILMVNSKLKTDLKQIIIKNK